MWTDQGTRDEVVAAAVKRLCRKRERPTAAIFRDSAMAAECAHRVQELGVRVPQDVAIVGYDYLPYAEMLRVPVSTIEQPVAAMAAAALDLAKTRLARPDAPPKHVVLSHQLVVREGGA